VKFHKVTWNTKWPGNRIEIWLTFWHSIPSAHTCWVVSFEPGHHDRNKNVVNIIIYSLWYAATRGFSASFLLLCYVIFNTQKQNVAKICSVDYSARGAIRAGCDLIRGAKWRPIDDKSKSALLIVVGGSQPTRQLRMRTFVWWSTLCSGTGSTIGLVAEDAVVASRRVFSRRASTLTMEYSMNEPKTNTRHTAIQTSIALVKDTAGIPRMCTELWVVIVSMVRIPREMRAGTDSRSIQKDTHDKRTTSRLGRNVERM